MSEEQANEEILRDIRRWVKIIGIQEVKPLLRDALTHEDDERETALRRTYHLTDGDHSTREIENYISFSRGWVSNRQNEWSRIGLVERESEGDQYHHILSLKEAGIAVPDLPDPEETEADSEQESEEDSQEETESSDNSTPSDGEADTTITESENE